MADGKQWTAENLHVTVEPSYCYASSQTNCGRYGRLYTWESARRACQSLGDGWRLPTDDEWRKLAKRNGGINEDSRDHGKTAYKRLLLGGDSGFAAVLGGNRTEEGLFERIEAHGFYWTSTESGNGGAIFYNFGRGSLALYRQPMGDKRMALSVRCIGD